MGAGTSSRPLLHHVTSGHTSILQDDQIVRTLTNLASRARGRASCTDSECSHWHYSSDVPRQQVRDDDLKKDIHMGDTAMLPHWRHIEMESECVAVAMTWHRCHVVVILIEVWCRV